MAGYVLTLPGFGGMAAADLCAYSAMSGHIVARIEQLCWWARRFWAAVGVEESEGGMDADEDGGGL